jgi:hypothetical protein
MKSTMTSVGMACLLILSSAALQAQFSVPGGLKLPSGTSASGSTAQNAGLGAGLSDAQIGSGVKDALAVGTKRAVGCVPSSPTARPSSAWREGR